MKIILINKRFSSISASFQNFYGLAFEIKGNFVSPIKIILKNLNHHELILALISSCLLPKILFRSILLQLNAQKLKVLRGNYETIRIHLLGSF